MTWHHIHCTGILHLRSSSLHPNHGGSREPIRHIISILRAACGLQGSQGTPTSTPEQGCHRFRQIHQLSMAHHLQQPSSMVAIYSMCCFGQPLAHIKLSSLMAMEISRPLSHRSSADESSADINLILDAQTTTSQEALINNAQNKTALIGELTKALLLRGVEVKQASGDADLVIALFTMPAADAANGRAAVMF